MQGEPTDEDDEQPSLNSSSLMQRDDSKMPLGDLGLLSLLNPPRMVIIPQVVSIFSPNMKGKSMLSDGNDMLISGLL
jgi:hypothetical protein